MATAAGILTSGEQTLRCGQLTRRCGCGGRMAPAGRLRLQSGIGLDQDDEKYRGRVARLDRHSDSESDQDDPPVGSDSDISGELTDAQDSEGHSSNEGSELKGEIGMDKFETELEQLRREEKEVVLLKKTQ